MKNLESNGTKCLENYLPICEKDVQAKGQVEL